MQLAKTSIGIESTAFRNFRTAAVMKCGGEVVWALTLGPPTNTRHLGALQVQCNVK